MCAVFAGLAVCTGLAMSACSVGDGDARGSRVLPMSAMSPGTLSLCESSVTSRLISVHPCRTHTRANCPIRSQTFDRTRDQTHDESQGRSSSQLSLVDLSNAQAAGDFDSPAPDVAAPGGDMEAVSPRRWRAAGTMPTPVLFATGSVAGDVAYITGGISTTLYSIGAIQRFDLASGRWLLPLRLSQSRFGHMQTTLCDGGILVAGGWPGSAFSPGQAMRDAWLIDPVGDSISRLPDLPAPAAYGTLHALSTGEAVVVSGRMACVLSTDRDAWRAIPLHESRRAHASVMIDVGRVLVVGGEGRDTMELIDLDAGLSTLLDVRLPQVLDDLTATRLSDGRVWIVGG